jgi:hypothetical protein
MNWFNSLSAIGINAITSESSISPLRIQTFADVKVSQKPPSAPNPKRAPPRCLARETEASTLAAGAPAWRRPPAVPGRRRAGGRLALQWAGPLRAGRRQSPLAPKTHCRYPGCSARFQ